jgi:hypothetical protein
MTGIRDENRKTRRITVRYRSGSQTTPRCIATPAPIFLLTSAGQLPFPTVCHDTALPGTTKLRGAAFEFCEHSLGTFFFLEKSHQRSFGFLSMIAIDNNFVSCLYLRLLLVAFLHFIRIHHFIISISMIQLGKFCIYLLTSLSLTTAFSPPRVVSRSSSSSSFLHGATTMEPPTEAKSKKGEMMGFDDNENDDGDDYGDLEYLIDSNESREMEDPFHILLMGSTFEKPKITVSYVSGSLTYVLDMPGEEANELSKFAREQGMSCLGTFDCMYVCLR